MRSVGARSVLFDNNPTIHSYASVVGPKEAEGPLKNEFDHCFTDSLLGQNSWEKAESIFQKSAVSHAIIKSKLKPEDIDVIFAGDLLNQCIASFFGLKDFNIPLIGVYGACSTMALSLINACIHVDSGAAQTAAAVTSSHFCSAERQYRYPLEYGGVRPPTSQWTVTGSGAVIITKNCGISAVGYTIGKIVDLEIKDANNMGAAMAPDDVKIRPYPKNEGMVFFYTQIQYLRGFLALFYYFKPYKLH